MDLKKIEEKIKKESGLGPATHLELNEITRNAPYMIDGVRVFRSAYMFEADPVPYDQWVFCPSGKLYRGLIPVLKELSLVPKNKQEALQISLMIVYCEDCRYQVYPNLLGPAESMIDQNILRKLKSPAAEEAGDHYEIELFCFFYQVRGESYLKRFRISIGKNIYKQEEEQIREAEQIR